MRRDELNRAIHDLYRAEHEALGERGGYELLDKARQWDLTSVLTSGGVIVFPHASVADCGHQIAAAVHACLDSGADRVLVISVLHAWNDEMEQARRRVAAGGSPAAEHYWGIQGPGLNRGNEWELDHALYSFRFFWQLETRRRGIRGPQVIERYPYLAGGHPEALPGIEALVELARDAVIVSTADPFHHGIGYGDPPEQSLAPEAGGLELARHTIEEGMNLLAAGDYWGYNQHCVRAKSDARDAGQVFRFLRGPLQGEILDLVASDATTLYQTPPPTWVAAPLVCWTRVIP
ncbi:MAG: hypothetical protein J7459_11340 [Chloroflexus sp.]|nr:hypothetical protein [Chloroflexus sp.]